VIAKRVDGAPVNSVFAKRAVKYDYLHVIGDALKDLPYFMYTWDVCSADAAQKKHAQYVDFVAATAKGCRWAMDNPGEAGAISRKILPDLSAGEAEFAAADFAQKKFWSPTGLLDRKTWDFTVDTLVKLRNIKGKMNYDDVVLADVVKEAENKK
jgi:ABC-type nitrate/sulfonate/bicarbonate transport system substrate-binding protein